MIRKIVRRPYSLHRQAVMNAHNQNILAQVNAIISKLKLHIQMLEEELSKTTRELAGAQQNVQILESLNKQEETLKDDIRRLRRYREQLLSDIRQDRVGKTLLHLSENHYMLKNII